MKLVTVMVFESWAWMQSESAICNCIGDVWVACRKEHALAL